MPQYIKKEGEVIYLLEYPTEKPTLKNYTDYFNYYEALRYWEESAVKTPFHESQKEKIKDWIFNNNDNICFEEQIEPALSEGILIPDGLCEKKPMYLDYTFLDDGEYSPFPPDNESIPKYFAFIKESKPVEETNEAVEFAEWINDNCVRFSTGLWQYGKDFDTKLTTSELYKIFKDSITRK